MRIARITERAMQPNSDGEWVVFAQMLVGRTYQYGALIYKTFDEARKAKEGDIIDSERVRFERRINGMQL